MRPIDRQLDAAAASAAEKDPKVSDQIIDALMARALHADACRDHALVAWVVMWDDPAYPDRSIARLVTTKPLPYVLTGDALAEVQEQLPPGLKWTERLSVHPPEVIEVWFAE